MLDRNGDALAWFNTLAKRWELGVPAAGTLLGYGFPERGIYGGVIRSSGASSQAGASKHRAPKPSSPSAYARSDPLASMCT